MNRADKINSISTTLDDAAVLRGRTVKNNHPKEPLLEKEVLQKKNPTAFKEKREAARNEMIRKKQRAIEIAKTKRNKKIVLGVTAGALATAGTIAGLKAIKKKKEDKKK